MRKLYLLALAASAALVPAAASAQGAPAAGHSWREGAMPTSSGPNRVVREVRQMHRAPGGQHGRRFGHIPRIGRGGFVSSGWFGPQFVVPNWNMYGFPQPYGGGRWIRYYDDALLIDRSGRVLDGRYGHDWDRYGDRWGYDDRGVPVYVGDGDYEPREDDYEWAERWEERGGRDVIVDRRHHGGQAYGYGYGHGCGCGPMVVTETTTTTAPVVELVTTYEYVTEYVPHRAKAAPRKRKVIRRAPAPAPARPGERG
jgi:Ni/Co efflux regulator RcnB